MKTLDKIPTGKIERATQLVKTGIKVGGNYVAYYGEKLVNPNLTKDMLDVLTIYGKENIQEMLEIHIRKNLPEGHGFLKFTHQYIQELLTNELTLGYMEQGDIL